MESVTSLPKEQFVREYLKRIDYHGDTTPCLETLIALQRQHLYHIPFENLDLLGDNFVPKLDAEHLFERIVRHRRGGVCYELNTCFYHLLAALGFSVCQISGRAMLELPMTVHVFTLVHLPEGDYIADVGFGDDPVPPLNVKGGVVHAYHADYWIEPDEEGLLRLFLRRPGQDPAFQYQFALTPRVQEDYMDTFRFTVAPGNTFFSQSPFCCRITPEGKILLLRGKLTVEQHNQIVTARDIAPGEETERCLREYFDLP